MDVNGEINLKKPSYSDLEELYELIKISTSGGTKLTPESLWLALSERQIPQTTPPTQSNSCHQFKLEYIQSNKPVAQALIAEVNNQVVGYIISHYHYSPWIGHGVNIDDIYVRRDLPKRELIERKLIEDVIASARLDRISALFFDSDRKEFDFMRSECKWYRNNEDCDWSLLRIL